MYPLCYTINKFSINLNRKCLTSIRFDNKTMLSTLVFELLWPGIYVFTQTKPSCTYQNKRTKYMKVKTSQSLRILAMQSQHRRSHKKVCTKERVDPVKVWKRLLRKKTRSSQNAKVHHSVSDPQPAIKNRKHTEQLINLKAYVTMCESVTISGFPPDHIVFVLTF